MTDGFRAILAGDVGGTNVRLARGTLGADGVLRLTERRAYRGEDFPALEPILERYLEDSSGLAPEAVALGLAGPVRGDAVRMTRRPWTVAADAVRLATGADKAVLINDFAAAAHSLPFVAEADIVPLGGPPRADEHWSREGARVLALGPGTGLGAAILTRTAGALTALDTESGHARFAPWNAETWEIAQAVTAQIGECAIENVVSGPGLSRLYASLSDGNRDRLADPAEIHRLAVDGDAHALRATALLCEILGSVAGDLALATGARDGVFIMGGVALSLKQELQQGGFRKRFETRPDFPDYLRAVPTMLVDCPHAGLIGAAAALVPDARAITVED